MFMLLGEPPSGVKAFRGEEPAYSDQVSASH